MSALLSLLLAVSPEVHAGFQVSNQALTANGVTSTRSSTTFTSVGVGLSYTPWSQLVGTTSASVALDSLDGDVLLGVQQWLRWRAPVTSWWSLEAGLAVSASLDVTQPSFSGAWVGPVLAVRVWRVELAWLPSLQVPLGRVARGAVVEARSLTVLPLGFALRVDLG